MKTFQGSRHQIQTMANLIWHFTSRNLFCFGGKEAVPAPVVVDAGKSAAVIAVFETDPATWGTRNVMTACGAIRYLSGDRREGHGHGRLSLKTRPRREHVAFRHADRMALIQRYLRGRLRNVWLCKRVLRLQRVFLTRFCSETARVCGRGRKLLG
jgi:hypothetical protein